MSGRRRKARELALQLLYQNDLAATPPEEMFRQTEEYLLARPDVQEYAARLVTGTLERRDELDEKLSERSEHWRLGRMPAVDRNLLRLALYELLFEPETPAAVVINEAVEIAKKFSTPSSGSFVNGVLDGIRRAETGAKGAGRVLALVALLAALPSVAGPGGDGREEMLYELIGPAPWRQVRPVEEPGYRVVLSTRDGKSLRATVETDLSPLPDMAAFPLRRAAMPADVRALLEAPRPPDGEADALANRLTADCRSALEAVERVIGYTAAEIRYVLPGPEAETAASTRRSGRGSCVGRSLVAEDLLLRAGIPARQVSGVLVAFSPEGLSPDSRTAWNAGLGGIRHRWIEAWVPGLGWIPSDPGGLANRLTVRHLALEEPPGRRFGVRPAAGTEEAGRPSLPAAGKGSLLARPRWSAGGAAPR
ncbi:MAG TPA: transcription antitermination factor NusB [Thermoanaerobaculia bacterium]|nr:transcription antitermination factor NusB [Thermoanaerobaculia bacterium]